MTRSGIATTRKDAATANLNEFLTNLGGTTPHIRDSWDEYQHISADTYVGEKYFTVCATVSDLHPGMVYVQVYDFRKTAQRESVFLVESNPSMAARFTLEAIAAYEQELGEVA